MPNLIVIAGCNGAGKSTFSSSFLPEGLVSYYYDRIFLENYNSLIDSELREKFARDETTKNFEDSIFQAIENKKDFCYETNFDFQPTFWAQKFKENGYHISLIFFCLDNQDIARHRIQVRTEFKGHYVDDKTVNIKWKAGYKNVNLHFDFFDNVLFIDNSSQNEIYRNLVQIESTEVVLMTNELPNYFESRLPRIYKLIKK